MFRDWSFLPTQYFTWSMSKQMVRLITPKLNQQHTQPTLHMNALLELEPPPPLPRPELEMMFLIHWLLKLFEKTAVFFGHFGGF